MKSGNVCVYVGGGVWLSKYSPERPKIREPCERLGKNFPCIGRVPGTRDNINVTVTTSLYFSDCINYHLRDMCKGTNHRSIL